ncbi:MAG: type II toxin-antitoxin system RelE/ParE family toxin [Casimicrobiaceae bacterium]
MILDFRSKETETIWRGEIAKRIPIAIQTVARRKLRMLNSARTLEDLRIPPANRLEMLRGELRGRYSIRINDQWRVCFRWSNAGASEVEIIDYH